MNGRQKRFPRTGDAGLTLKTQYVFAWWVMVAGVGAEHSREKAKSQRSEIACHALGDAISSVWLQEICRIGSGKKSAGARSWRAL